MTDTYLLLLLIEIVNDDADEEVECEERSEYDEDHEVKIHLQVDLVFGLVPLLEEPSRNKYRFRSLHTLF